MDTPTLHHVLGSWWVGEYPLRLLKERGHWRVLSQPSEVEANQWLHRCRLSEQRFRTRKEALEALLAALEMPGSIEPSGRPACKRLAAGRYRLAGGLVAVKNRRAGSPIKWEILKPQEGQQWGPTVGSSQSLWRAAWIAQARADDREPKRPAQVRGH